MASHDRGFVLVNALILVAALAGIATLLLARAEGARNRAFEVQNAAQIRLYLDAFEALAITQLTVVDAGQSVTHLGQPWAGTNINVELDRGRVAGRVVDLQGRFNINWLANPEDAWALAGFERLLVTLALSPELAGAIAGFVHPQGPDNPQRYHSQTPPVAPVGGPVLMPSQLLAIPELSDRDFARLSPFIAALPGDSALNVNTASMNVMRSLVPGLSTAQFQRLDQSRQFEPFASPADFFAQARAFAGPGTISEDNEPRFTISSRWFAASISAELGLHQRHRRAVFERQPLPEGTHVAYRRQMTGAPETNRP